MTGEGPDPPPSLPTLLPSKSFPQLPTEIWAQIVEILHDSVARLYPLLLVSWALHGEAVRVIYRTLALNKDYSIPLDKLMDLFRLLVERSQYAQLVDRFNVFWATFSDGPFKEYSTAMNYALRSMINLRSLSISPWKKGTSLVNIGFLLSGCSFRLRSLRLHGIMGQDIRQLEPYATELHELHIIGSDNYGFEGSLFSDLRVLDLETCDQLLLEHLKGCDIRALRWLSTQPVQLSGDPYPPLRSLTISVHQHISIVESVSRAFPYLRYFGLQFMDRKHESLNSLAACLWGLHHLEFLKIEHAALKDHQYGSNQSRVARKALRERIVQETLDATPSLQCVSIEGFWPQWRGEPLIQEPYSGPLWMYKKWWN